MMIEKRPSLIDLEPESVPAWSDWLAGLGLALCVIVWTLVLFV